MFFFSGPDSSMFVLCKLGQCQPKGCKRRLSSPIKCCYLDYKEFLLLCVISSFLSFYFYQLTEVKNSAPFTYGKCICGCAFSFLVCSKFCLWLFTWRQRGNPKLLIFKYRRRTAFLSILPCSSLIDQDFCSLSLSKSFYLLFVSACGWISRQIFSICMFLSHLPAVYIDIESCWYRWWVRGVLNPKSLHILHYLVFADIHIF